MESGDAGDIGTAIVKGLITGRAESASRSSSISKEFALSDLSGEELLALFEMPPPQASEWLTRRLKEIAKAHLRPDQGLCKTCGEIYTLAMAGHTRDGFCSPICKRKVQAAAPAAAAPAPAGEKTVVTCPHCNRKFKSAAPPGKPIVCAWCQKPFQRP